MSLCDVIWKVLQFTAAAAVQFEDYYYFGMPDMPM